MSILKIQAAIARNGRAWLNQQVALAWQAKLDATAATKRIADNFIDFGIEHGFMPDEPIHVAPDLKSLRFAGLSWNYGEIPETTIST